MGKILIIVESSDDLYQCWEGLKLLKRVEDEKCISVKVYIANQLRHTERLQWLLKSLFTMGSPPDVIITCSGSSNLLTGGTDGFLRYSIKDYSIPVIGVGIMDDINNRAAYVRMACTKDTQAIIKDENGIAFMGRPGFFQACIFALKGKFKKIIVSENYEEFRELSLEEALNY